MTDLEQQLRQYVETAFAEVPETTAAAVVGATGGPAPIVVAADVPTSSPGTIRGAEAVEAFDEPAASAGVGAATGGGRAPRVVAGRRRGVVGVAAAVVLALVAFVAVVAIESDGPDPRVATGGRDDPVVTDTDTDPVPSVSGEWTVDLGGEIPYAPVVVDGAVVVVSMDPASDRAAATVIALEEGGWAQDRTVASRRWSFDLGSPVVSQPVAADGLILLRLASDRLIAVGADDGVVRWQMTTGSGTPEAVSRPVVSGGRVYIGSPHGLLQAVDLSSGEERWRRRLDGAVASPPTPAGDDLLVATTELPVGSGPGRVYAVDRHGKVLGARKVVPGATSPPAGDRSLFAVSSSPVPWLTISAIPARPDGAQWTQRFSAGWLSAPVVTDSVVTALSSDGRMKAYSTTEPDRLVWSARVGENQAPELQRSGGRILATGSDVAALEADSGAVSWRAPVPDAFFGESDDPDRIVAVSRRGSLAVVDARNGSLVVDFTLHDTPSGAVLHDGTLVWTGSGGVVTTARLEDAGANALQVCAETAVEPEGPDGLPNRDTAIDEAGSRAAAERNGEFLRRRFGEVRSVTVRPATMGAWARDDAGTISVEQVSGYEIVVVLARRSDCPSAPYFLEGYPTRFYAAP